jgi:glycosyltransferase involved in cell wall biosynthesis
LFADTFFEANGVGTLSRQLAEFAKMHGYPMLVIRGGQQTGVTQDGSLETLELKRSPASFPVDKTLYFDPLLMRHRKLVLERVRTFKPDLIHITGPGDMGLLGAWVAHILGLASVGSWHTNFHEYLSRRLQMVLKPLPERLRKRACNLVEHQTLRFLMRFYRSARFTVAPNEAMVNLLRERTKRPSHLMLHGVDLSRYKPAPLTNDKVGRPFCIGYVGRLTTEKNVRNLAIVEEKLIAKGEHDYRFLIVGEGGQESWLREHLKRAEVAGVLRGENLAAAYRQMDVLVFPSRTDTFGLVLLEAMASGVPVILAPETGRRVGVEDGVSGFLTEDVAESVLRLMHDPPARESMGRAAHNFASTQGWDRVFNELYRTFGSALHIQNSRTHDTIST